MSSRIEQIIEEIEEYIDRDCKFQPLSQTKIIVNKEHMDELLRELRMKTPDEIKRYQKIIANRDAILADAKAKADAMIEEAQVQTTELVSEHEIMQQAYAQANEIVTQATAQAQEIVDNATMDANEIRIGAIQYRWTRFSGRCFSSAGGGGTGSRRFTGKETAFCCCISVWRAAVSNGPGVRRKCRP